jgi:hypothetical protein
MFRIWNCPFASLIPKNPVEFETGPRRINCAFPPATGFPFESLTKPEM